MAEAVLVDPAQGAASVRRALGSPGRPIVLAVQARSEGLESTDELLEGLLRHPMPVTGVVGGRIEGDSVALLLACDLLVMTPRSSLSLRPAGRGETVLLSMRLGSDGAARVWFRGGRLTAAEAARSGWATIVRKGFSEAVGWAQTRYDGLSPAALGLLRPLLYRQVGLPSEQAWALERAAFALAFDTGHPAEGVAAFLEKRKPQF